MTFCNGRPLVFPALVVAAVAVGCSSKPATARAYVAASLTQGTGGGSCNFGSSTPNARNRNQASESARRLEPGARRQRVGPRRRGDARLHRPADGGKFTCESRRPSQDLAGGGGAMTSSGRSSSAGNRTAWHVLEQCASNRRRPTARCNSPTWGSRSLANNAPKVAAGRDRGHLDCPQAAARHRVRTSPATCPPTSCSKTAAADPTLARRYSRTARRRLA